MCTVNPRYSVTRNNVTLGLCHELVRNRSTPIIFPVNNVTPSLSVIRHPLMRANKNQCLRNNVILQKNHEIFTSHRVQRVVSFKLQQVVGLTSYEALFNVLVHSIFNEW
jgi:hypothetical protein